MACKTEWLCEEPEQYEGYNYLVTVLKPESDEETMRFYPGSKKGKFDPTYWGSPETHGLQYFLDIAEYGATREILKCGFYDNVISHESKMLLEVNAKHNPLYYNDSNNAGHKEIKVWNAIDKIKKKIGKKKGAYPIVWVDKRIVAAYKRLQVRNQMLYLQHVAQLREKLNDTKGEFLNEIDPILVLEDYYGEGEHLLIGGNHTTEGSVPCKFVKDVPVQLIPKKDWKNLIRLDEDGNINETHIVTLGRLPNKNPKIPTRKMEKEEHSDWVAEQYLKNNINPDDDRIMAHLMEMNLSQKEITCKGGILDKARERIEDRQYLGSNQKKIMWGEERLLSPANKQILKRIKQNANCNGDIALIRSSAGLKATSNDIMTSVQDWVEWENQPENKDVPKRTHRLTIYIYHKTHQAMEEFNKTIFKEKSDMYDAFMEVTRRNDGTRFVSIRMEQLPYSEYIDE